MRPRATDLPRPDPEVVEAWRSRGRRLAIGGDERVFVRAEPPAVTRLAPPLVLIHGARTASLGWRRIWEDVNQGRALLAPDLPGHGLSGDTARPRSPWAQADVVARLVRDQGHREVDLLTHGLGTGVGAELCARDLEGTLGFTIRRRVVLNGPVYPGMVGEDGPPTAEARGSRWSGALETHPAPLAVIWGDADPGAPVAMAERLRAARPDLDWVRLPGVGHFPMLEVPSSVARVVLDVLS